MDLEKKLEQIKPYQLNCNVFSVYDYPTTYSMQELLNKFFETINNCVDLCNNVLDLAKWLVNEGLELEVAKKLEIWLQDGTLASIINEKLFGELNAKIDLIKSSNINVKEFGAKGDGETDDTDAIKKAIEYGESIINDRLIGGVTIYFPMGVYPVSDILNITKSGVVLKGESITTTIKDIGLTKSLINFKGDMALFRCGIQNISISSNTMKKSLINIDNMINSIFDNILISNSYDCFKINNVGKVYFSNIILTQDNIDSVSRYGFDFSQASDVHMTNIQVFCNATPTLPNSMVIRSCDGIYFSNCHWHGNFLFLPSDNKTLASVFFENCYFDRGTDSCLAMQGSTTNPYRNFMFSNCYFRDASRAVNISTTGNVELIQFTGCSFTQCRFEGVYITSNAKNVSFSGCSFADNNTVNNSTYGHMTSGANNLTITGCQFVRGGENGFGLQNNGSNCLISNNNFKECSGNKLVLHGSNNAVFNNAGVVRKKQSSVSIPTGQTEVMVNHGLTGITSEMIMVIPRSLVTTNFRIAWVDGSSFRILINSAESNSTLFTYWIDGDLYN